MPIVRTIEYTFPTKIIFGADVFNRIGEIAVEYTNKVFIITNGDVMRKIGLLPRVENLLEKSGVDYILYDNIRRDPENDVIDEVAELLRQSHAKLVIALGSSSVINSAKASAYLAKNEGSVVEYLNGKIGSDDAVPVIIIPTIPAVVQAFDDKFILQDSDDNIRKEFRNKSLFPLYTLVDPKTTLSLPLNYTVGSGFAVLSNAIESYISASSNPISDSSAVRAVELVGKSLKTLFMNKDDLTARSNVMMATVLVSLSLLTSHLGSCEATVLALSGKSNIYKNIAHAIILPHVMEFNLTVSPNKYVHIAKSLGEEVANITVVEAAIKAIEGVRKLLFDLKVPQKLSDYKVNKEDLPLISSVARRYSFLNYVPSPISKEDILNIMLTAY